MKAILPVLGLAFMMLMSLNGLAQKNEKGVVTGKVFPAGLQTAMVGVQVQVNGSGLFVETNAQGIFKITVDSFPVLLVFSKDKYQTQTLKVKRPSDVVVHMMVSKKKDKK